MSKKWMIAGLMTALAGSFAGSASAQEASSAAAAEAQKEDGGAQEEAKRHPMGWAGIGLKLGVAGVGSGSFEMNNPIYDPSGMASDVGVDPAPGYCPTDSPKCRVETNSRTGFQLTLAITLGGDGFGWDIDPYMNFASGAMAAGFYTGPKFDIHIIDPLYIGFGFGLKAAYVMTDDFDYAADLYGRVPIRGTYYLKNDLGIVAELGFGYGYSGYVALPQTLANGEETDTDIQFGSAMTWDFQVGTRWP